MIIGTICSYPHNVIMGVSALVGAGIYAGVSIYEAKKVLGKKFKFDLRKIIDTAWQSAAAGIVAGMAIGCNWHGIAIAMVTGIGADKICSKLKINKVQFLNIIQWLFKFMDKKKK